jgi:hypothetical protein
MAAECIFFCYFAAVIAKNACFISVYFYDFRVASSHWSHSKTPSLASGIIYFTRSGNLFCPVSALMMRPKQFTEFIQAHFCCRTISLAQGRHLHAIGGVEDSVQRTLIRLEPGLYGCLNDFFTVSSQKNPGYIKLHLMCLQAVAEVPHLHQVVRKTLV